jgi:hypothetical protein
MFFAAFKHPVHEYVAWPRLVIYTPWITAEQSRGVDYLLADLIRWTYGNSIVLHTGATGPYDAVGETQFSYASGFNQGAVIWRFRLL